MFKVGQEVRIKRTTLQGKVVRFVAVNGGTSLAFLVAYKDHEEVNQERPFAEEDLEQA